MESRRRAVSSVFQAVLDAQKQDEDSPTTSNQDQDLLESATAPKLASRQHSQEPITLALQLAAIDKEHAMSQQRRGLSMVEDRCLDHGDDLFKGRRADAFPLTWLGKEQPPPRGNQQSVSSIAHGPSGWGANRRLHIDLIGFV